MKVLLFLALLIVLVSARRHEQQPKIPLGFTWKNCSNNPHFQVQQVIMTPYPAVKGANVTVHAHGFQDETVSSGTWDTKIYYYGIEVQHDSGGVCDLIPNCACPCKSGAYTTSQSVYVTEIAPSGSYTGVYSATDQSGQVLACISYAFEIA